MPAMKPVPITATSIACPFVAAGMTRATLRIGELRTLARMPDEALDAALDALYGLDRDEFVAARKLSAATLRAAGDKDGAKQLASARRPSTSAWALNQLTRRHPELVASLLERSAELRAAQSRPQSAQPNAVRDAIRAHRRSIDDATEATLAILGSRANDGFRNQIVSTLRAATTDAGVGEELRVGRLVREIVSVPGFPEASGLTLVRAPSGAEPVPDPRAARKPPERAAAVRAEAKAREIAAAQAEREAKRRADLALRDRALQSAAEADAEARRAEDRVARLRAELETARRELREANERSRKARAEAARLRR
jgi:hypothetical protein